MSNVVHMPIVRNDLNELVKRIKLLLIEHQPPLNAVEAMGVLTIAEMEMFDHIKEL